MGDDLGHDEAKIAKPTDLTGVGQCLTILSDEIKPSTV